MTLLLWTVVIGCGLPYLAHAFHAREKLRSGTYDRHTPRAQSMASTGLAARTWAAQQNAWEALAVFAPIALIAHLVGADPVRSGWLGLAWVLARLLHLAAYLADLPLLRSAAFALANLALLLLLILLAL